MTNSDGSDEFRDECVHDEDLERAEDDAERTAREARELKERGWMAAWAAGDRGAGNLVFGEYLKPITRFYQAKVRDLEVVKRLVSNWSKELTEAAKRDVSFDVSVKAYIYAIARNVLYRHFRDKQRNREDPTDFTLADVDDGESSFIVNQRAELRPILRAMRRINFDQAIAVEMRFFEGFTVPEIAAVIGCPSGTISSRLRLALVNLQREMLAQAQDPAAMARTTSTFKWLSGLIRHVELLKARRGAP